MTKAYTSNLTRDQFEWIEPLLSPAKPSSRPRTVGLWAVLNAIFYRVKQGCGWRDLPSDFPAWPTVYTDYRAWVKDGTWDASTTDYGPGYGSRKDARKVHRR